MSKALVPYVRPKPTEPVKPDAQAFPMSLDHEPVTLKEYVKAYKDRHKVGGNMEYCFLSGEPVAFVVHYWQYFTCQESRYWRRVIHLCDHLKEVLK